MRRDHHIRCIRGMRGQFHALELMLVFVGWLLLMQFTWQMSAQVLHAQEEQWKDMRAFQLALAQGDVFMEQHHFNPWQGCAAYSESKKRTQNHLISAACIRASGDLVNGSRAPEGISEVKWNGEIVFRQEMEQSHCAAVKRIGIDSITRTPTILEVKACA